MFHCCIHRNYHSYFKTNVDVDVEIPLEIRASLDFTCIFNPIFGKRIFDIVQNYIILSVERMLVSSLIISK